MNKLLLGVVFVFGSGVQQLVGGGSAFYGRYFPKKSFDPSVIKRSYSLYKTNYLPDRPAVLLANRIKIACGKNFPTSLRLPLHLSCVSSSASIKESPEAIFIKEIKNYGSFFELLPLTSSNISTLKHYKEELVLFFEQFKVTADAKKIIDGMIEQLNFADLLLDMKNLINTKQVAIEKEPVYNNKELAHLIPFLNEISSYLDMQLALIQKNPLFKTKKRFLRDSVLYQANFLGTVAFQPQLLTFFRSILNSLNQIIVIHAQLFEDAGGPSLIDVLKDEGLKKLAPYEKIKLAIDKPFFFQKRGVRLELKGIPAPISQEPSALEQSVTYESPPRPQVSFPSLPEYRLPREPESNEPKGW